MNSLSIVASFGALVWIFQEGNLSALLGFQPLGYVETTQPVILFCVLFGLSMDYEVFLLSRMKETWDRDRRQRRGGRVRARAERPDRHLGRPHRGRRGRLVRLRRHRAHQGARGRDGDRRRRSTRRSSGRSSSRRRMRLLGRWNWWMPARIERWLANRLPLAEGDGPGAAAMTAQGGMTRARVAVAVVRLAALAVGRRRLRRRSDPRQPAGGRGRRRRRPPRRSPRPPDPSPDRPPARRRAARPADRVVVLHRPPARRGDRRPLRLRVRHLPRRARRLPGELGVASRRSPTRPHDRFLYAQRAEIGPQVDLRPAAGGFDLALVPDAARAGRRRRTRPWRMTGSGGHDRLVRDDDGRRGGAARARSGRSASTSGWRPPSRAALHDRRRLDRLRAGRRLVLLLADAAWRPRGSLTLDGRTLDRRRRGLVRPPVGRLHRGRWRRLGLVRGEPGRRHGPDPVARPRPGRRRTSLVYGTYVDADGTTTHLPADAFRVTVTGHWTSPRTGAAYPAGWHIERARPGPGDRPDADGRGPGARHARRRPGSCTGRARRWSGRRATGRRWPARPTSS